MEKVRSIFNNPGSRASILNVGTSFRTDRTPSTINFEESSDQQILLEADKLIKDIQFHLESVNPSKNNQSVLSKIRQISTRKSNSAQSTELLSQRIEGTLDRLKKIELDSVHREDDLLSEASQLYYKVLTCIHYSQEILPTQNGDIEMLTKMFHDIISWTQYLQAMIKFHQEIIHQEQSQSIYNTNSFMSSSDSSPRVISTQEEREDDLLMVSKYARIKKLHKRVNKHIDQLKIGHDCRVANISALESSRIKLAEKLSQKLKVDLQKLEIELNKTVDGNIIQLIKSHKECKDCQDTQRNTVECLVQLDSYHRQSCAVLDRMTELTDLRFKLDNDTTTTTPAGTGTTTTSGTSVANTSTHYAVPTTHQLNPSAVNTSGNTSHSHHQL